MQDHVPADQRYEPPNQLLGDPGNRPLRVLIAGCGVSGIMMAYKIQKACQNVELVMFDKNSNVGGVWWENRYPRAGCDIPCQAYMYNFAPNPDWPRYCAFSEDVWKYLDRVCKVFDLRKYMNFNTRITRATWHDEKSQWMISMRKEEADQNPGPSVTETCDLFLYATGVLNHWKYPQVKGLDSFRGKVFHTAQWPDDYKEQQWSQDRIAVIGSGASSVGTVTGLQPHAKHLDIFVRTGTIFSAIAENFGDYRSFTQEELESFQTDSSELIAHAKRIEKSIGDAIDFQLSGTDTETNVTSFFKNRMAEKIKNKRLLEGYTPSWGIGCQRVLPADPYMQAIQEDNVNVHFAAAVEFTEDSVIDSSGKKTEVDTIVCATGFETLRRCRFPIIGKDGIDLATQWGDDPQAYLGITVPNMPNFYLFMGPSWPVHNGSVMGPLDANGDYVIQVIQKMQRDQILWIAPRQDRTDQFQEHAQAWIRRTTWTQNCRSWFKNNETNKVSALWPGTALHFREAVLQPRFEDYEIHYVHDNPFANLGNGYAWREKNQDMDPTPFLSVEKIDPLWRRVVLEKKKSQGENEKCI